MNRYRALNFIHKLPKFIMIWVLLSLLGGCGINPITGHSGLALMDMSPAEVVALGKHAFQLALQKGGGRYPDKSLSDYVSSVGQRLVSQNSLPAMRYNFAVINDSEPNAFALPGGYVAITRGLLVNLSNEAELAAVLGHEIGHEISRHSLLGLQGSTLWGGTTSLLDGLADAGGYGWLTSPVGRVAADLIDMRFSSEQEREADHLGIDYMVKAGYDPVGILQLQEYFHREVDQGANPQWTNGLFRSHPFSVQRLAETRQYLAVHSPQNTGNGLDAVPFARAMERLKQTQKGYEIYDLARQAEAQGDLAAAIALYHRSLLEAPDEPLILCRLGLAYLRQEDLIPARRYLLKAVNLQGDYYQSRLGLGYVYQQKQQFQKAQEQLEAGFKLLPTLEGGYMLAVAREQNDDIEGARPLYAAVAKADTQGKLGRNAAARLEHLGQ